MRSAEYKNDLSVKVARSLAHCNGVKVHGCYCRFKSKKYSVKRKYSTCNGVNVTHYSVYWFKQSDGWLEEGIKCVQVKVKSSEPSEVIGVKVKVSQVFFDCVKLSQKPSNL